MHLLKVPYYTQIFIFHPVRRVIKLNIKKKTKQTSPENKTKTRQLPGGGKTQHLYRNLLKIYVKAVISYRKITTGVDQLFLIFLAAKQHKIH